MSEPVVAEQPDLSAMTASPGQKRKRDQESPGAQRPKRAAPPASMSADTAAFIENAIEATHVAAASGVNVADFNALQQAAAADHSETADPSNATSTAQAALGMYPTLHVPPSTEEQFAAQAGAEGDDSHDGSYNPDVPPPHGLADTPGAAPGQQQPPPSNGVQPQAGHRYSTSSASANVKPSVGSEEWHKMRKDNHKEGEHGAPPRDGRELTLSDSSGTPATRDNQRGHQRAGQDCAGLREEQGLHPAAVRELYSAAQGE